MLEYTINGKDKIAFTRIWYHHSPKTAATDSYEIVVSRQELAFVKLVEQHCQCPLDRRDVELKILRHFQRSSRNPVQWLLNLESQKHRFQHKQEPPWNLSWAFYSIKDFIVLSNKIIIRGTAERI